MKVKSAFEDANGALLYPGQDVPEEMFSDDELKSLEARGYVTEGDGYEAGKPTFDAMSTTELRAYGRALGLDVDSIRRKSDLRAAIDNRENANRTALQPPAGQQQVQVVTFGPKVTPKAEVISVPVDSTAQEVAAKQAEARQEDVKAAKEAAAAAPPAAPEPKPAGP